MLRLSTLLLFATVLCAQTARTAAEPPAPHGVDQALRARVTQFLNYHITGEFRKAEALVAADSKDVFYNRSKPRYMSCKGITSVHYSEHFTKAYVTAMCALPVVIQPSDNELQSDSTALPWTAPTVPLPSMWKLEHGKWFWYVDKNLDRRSPFGTMPMVPTGQPIAPGAMLPMIKTPAGTAAPAPPEGFNATPQGSMADPGMLAAIQAVHVPVTAASLGKVPEADLHHVKLEKSSITLDVGSSVKVKISNDAGDSRQIMLLGQLTGIEAKLESNTIKGGESTVLDVKATAGAKSASLNMVVVTTGELLSLSIAIN
ncbi:MAG: hypothetical protein P4L56_01425 [Candidatus Sulfopaludibacter sp.]|nr:hypothetical protein [Candidatus Sulfopaludibacter sp.]